MQINKLIPIWVRQRVPKVIKELVPHRWRSHSVPIYNLGASTYYDQTDRPKRALLSYITTPFRLPSDDARNIQFSNIGIAHSIVHVLNELGYIIDVVEWTDTRFVPNKKYDLFIGHGGCNFKHIARNLLPHAVKIYFSTGIYWKEHNRRQAERSRLLEERRGVRLRHDRRIYYSEEYANQSADGIICLDSQVAKDSYSKFPFVIQLNNAAYHVTVYDHFKKDFASGRDKFLFFAGSGNVHKGLDILLEAFTHVDAHLYICQHIEPDFYRVYRHELEDFPNIHMVGWIPMRSPRFYELIARCNFVISPCGEGGGGAIVECMHHGLIPVVIRHTINPSGGCAIELNACSIDEIVKVVQDLSQHSPQWCEEMSRRTRQVAVTEFSEAAFLRNMKAAIEHVIAIGVSVCEK